MDRLVGCEGRGKPDGTGENPSRGNLIIVDPRGLEELIDVGKVWGQLDAAKVGA